MNAKELREKSDEELIKLKKKLSYQLIKSKSLFGQGQVKTKERKREGRSFATMGQKTSLTKDIRRNIARINTILHERKLNKLKIK